MSYQIEKGLENIAHADVTLGMHAESPGSAEPRLQRHVRLPRDTSRGVAMRVVLIRWRACGQKTRGKLMLGKTICCQTALECVDAKPEQACGQGFMPTSYIQGA